jgi:hypothetical protein
VTTLLVDVRSDDLERAARQCQWQSLRVTHTLDLYAHASADAAPPAAIRQADASCGVDGSAGVCASAAARDSGPCGGGTAPGPRLVAVVEGRCRQHAPARLALLWPELLWPELLWPELLWPAAGCLLSICR